MSDTLVINSVPAPAQDGNGEGWEISADLRKMKMRDKRAFMRACVQAEQEKDEGPLYPWLAKFIRRWPYRNLNPTSPGSYDELTTEQFEEALQRVLKAFQPSE